MAAVLRNHIKFNKVYNKTIHLKGHVTNLVSLRTNCLPLRGCNPLVAATRIVNINGITCSKRYSTDTVTVPSDWIDNQSTKIANGARISRLCKDEKLFATHFDDYKTLYEGFQRGLRISGDKPCLGWRPNGCSPYSWMTYKEVNNRAEALGAGLVHMGLKPGSETRIGLYSKNRPEYTIADQAFYRHSHCGVPLYDTLGPDACNFIVNQADLNTIICDNVHKVKILVSRKSKLPNLTTIIVMEYITEELKAELQRSGLTVYNMIDVERIGEKNPTTHTPPKPEDICLICYTSGTTGLPKGAMLSHANLVATISGSYKLFEAFGIPFGSDDVVISYLPLAHSYERIVEGKAIGVGARIGYFQGDITRLIEDIKELKPTLFPTVPRLLYRFYDKVMFGVNQSTVKKILFNQAISSKNEELKKGIIRYDTFWDKTLFKAVQGALGGRLRVITTGSAPISGTVLTQLRLMLGCPIIEGYGLTENAAVSNVTIAHDTRARHVGPPMPCTMIKLVDVPDMNYYASDNRGEVCLKGHNVFKGYLKDPKKTKETLDDDGWLYTGDIGEWLPNGSLRIIDRKKNIFKLTQGEYIAPEKIENILVQSPWVAQIFVHGDNKKSCIVGIVVPDPETFPALIETMGLSGTLEELVTHPDVKSAILKDLHELGERNNLSSLERLEDLYLHHEPFTVENGLLTPTFKTRRNIVSKYFEKQIAAMYEDIAKKKKKK